MCFVELTYLFHTPYYILSSESKSSLILQVLMMTPMQGQIAYDNQLIGAFCDKTVHPEYFGLG